jgi:hypothetical protein
MGFKAGRVLKTGGGWPLDLISFFFLLAAQLSQEADLIPLPTDQYIELSTSRFSNGIYACITRTTHRFFLLSGLMMIDRRATMTARPVRRQTRLRQR